MARRAVPRLASGRLSPICRGYLRARPETDGGAVKPSRASPSVDVLPRKIRCDASLQIVLIMRSMVPESFLGGCSVGADTCPEGLSVSPA